MPCCKAKHFGNWCKDHPLIYKDKKGNEHCVFHAPKGKKGISLSEFNERIFEEIQKAKNRNKKCDLSGTIFEGEISFEQYRGNKPLPAISFEGATFLEEPSFWHTVFKKDASFKQAVFAKWVSFWDAAFMGKACFDDTVFKEGASFWRVKFNNVLSFKKALFDGEITFEEAIFQGETSFDNAVFSKGASFLKTIFIEWISLDKAVFNESLKKAKPKKATRSRKQR